MKIHFIGNSHVSLFSGSYDLFQKDQIDIFKTYHLGPTIAYNFYEHHFFKVLEIIKNSDINKEEDYICLVVGEVDCRWHLPLQANIQNKNINDIVIECVNRFFRCHLELQRMGYKIISWGGHPSTTSGHCDNLNCPVFGECLYRNKIGNIFKNYLKEISDSNNIKFVSIYDYLLNDDGTTNMSFFRENDYCHLNPNKCLEHVYSELKENNIITKNNNE